MALRYTLLAAAHPQDHSPDIEPQLVKRVLTLLHPLAQPFQVAQLVAHQSKLQALALDD